MLHLPISQKYLHAHITYPVHSLDNYLRSLQRKGWHLAERREGEVVGIEVVAEVLQEVGGVLVEVSH